jgi:hypothetical protein
VFSAALASLSATARAHFILVEPESYSEQGFLGDPQKSAPCGQADPHFELEETGFVTSVKSGSRLTIAIRETIFHPGHYRVSIAPDLASFPPDPPVTAGATACGSTQIESAPTLPLLADGLLVHTEPFDGLQTMEVQLPDGFTCEKCVLQVTEFMSDHALNVPGGCYYHHCATLTINPTGEGEQPPPRAGCQCEALPGAGLAALLGAFARRRPRRERAAG